MKLVANPNSWRGTKGTDEIDMRVIKEATTALSAFDAGEIHFLQNVAIANFEQARTMKDAAIKSGPANGFRGWEPGAA